MSPGRMVALVLGLLLCVGVLAGCEPTLHQETGLVVDVQQASLASVDGFHLRTPDGRTVEFSTRTMRFDLAFPAQHLSEHLALAQPITVTYKVVDDRNEVLKLADADER